MEIVETRVDDLTLKEANAVLAPLGLSTSVVCGLLIERIAKDKSVPFELFEPNAETREAIEASRRGEGVVVGGIGDLFADLHAED
jgi:DNA-damage-inducible protein J